MEAAAADDPFGSLVKLCEPTASQEEILRNCPFAREFEAFPDLDPDGLTSLSQSWASSEHPVVMMVSPPDSHGGGGSVDQNTTQDEDKYHTPPDHPLSLASDSDDPKQPPPLPEPTVGGGDDDQAVEEEEEEEEENLGFRSDGKLKSCDGNLRGEQPPPPPPPATVERVVKVEVEENPEVLESQSGRNQNGEWCDCVIRDHEIEILEFVSDRKRGLEGEILVNDWKKTRLCESYLNTEIVDLDSEGCDEESCFDEKKMVVSVDSGDRIDKLDKGGVNLLDTATEEDVGISEDEKMCGNGLTDEDITTVADEVEGNEILCNDAKEDGWNCKFGNLRENGMGVDEWIGGEKLCADGRGGDGIIGAETMRGSGEEGDSREKGNSDGVICEAEKSGISGGRALRKALLVIDKFKYDGSGSGNLASSGKKGGVLGEQELPPSVMGQGNGGGKKVKGGSFLDILDLLKSVLGEPDDCSEHDFLETAKMRSMVFPRPRWLPPEGFD